MKFDRNILLFPVIIILFIGLFLSSKIIELIPANRPVFVDLTVYIIMLAIFIFLTYKDIMRKKYTTTTYIVILDILAIIYIIGAAYGNYLNYYETDLLSKIERNLNIYLASIFFLGVIWGKSLLSNSKYIRK